MECRKCPYFEKIKNMMHGNYLIVGFCKLRQKHVSDETIGAEFCKDKAVIEIDEVKKVSTKESEEEFVKRTAFGG